MNKIAIPALLAATIMVAGAFAFMPVEQASTVHIQTIATIAANQAQLVTAVDADLNDLDTQTFSCTDDYLLVGITLDLSGIVFGDSDTVLVTIDGDQVSEVILDSGPVAVLEASEAALANTDTVFDYSITESGNEVLNKIRISVSSDGVCTFE